METYETAAKRSWVLGIESDERQPLIKPLVCFGRTTAWRRDGQQRASIRSGYVPGGYVEFSFDRLKV